MDFERRKRMVIEFRMVPLIDVVFFLIFYFIVAGTVQPFEMIPIQLPTASSGRVLEEGEISIILGQHDELLLNDELVTLEQLQPQIQNIFIKFPSSVVTIKADARLSASHLLAVMDLVKAAGGKNISLVTQKLS